MSDANEFIGGSTPRSGAAGIGRFKVVHLPVYSENQYQPLLMKRLAERGMQVIDGGGGGNFLRTALFRWRADLYHFHWLHPYLLRRGRLSSFLRATRFLLELVLIRLSGARIVWTVHNLVNHDRRFPKIERIYSTIFAHVANGIVVHSDAGRLEIKKVYKLSERKPIAVIPQGSYVERYRNRAPRAESRARLGLPPDDFVFLFLGRIEPYKGVLDLIQAFGQLPGASHLLMAGRVSDSSLLTQLHHETRGQSRIKLDAGFVDDDELQTYFNAADVFVFPAREILHSSSVSLAMSFGLACIAPAIAGIKEMLGDHGGILYDPHDPTGLLTAMRSAIERRSELRVAGQRNLLRARDNNWSSAAERTAAFYCQLIGDRVGILRGATDSKENVSN